MTEKILKTKVCKLLKDLQKQNYPIYFEVRQAGGLNYKVGLPDLWIVINGVHFEIELKSPEKKIIYKPEQLYWINKFNNIGIKAFISNDYEEIENFIFKIIKKLNIN